MANSIPSASTDLLPILNLPALANSASSGAGAAQVHTPGTARAHHPQFAPLDSVAGNHPPGGHPQAFAGGTFAALPRTGRPDETNPSADETAHRKPLARTRPPLSPWLQNTKRDFPRQEGESNQRYGIRLARMSAEELGLQQKLTLAEAARVADTFVKALQNPSHGLVPVPQRLLALGQEKDNRRQAGESKQSHTVRLFLKYRTASPPMPLYHACLITGADMSTISRDPRVTEARLPEQVRNLRERFPRDLEGGESRTQYAKRLQELAGQHGLEVTRRQVAEAAQLNHLPQTCHVRAPGELTPRLQALQAQCLEHGRPSRNEYLKRLLKLDPSLNLNELSALTGQATQNIRRTAAYQMAPLPRLVAQTLETNPQLEGEGNESYSQRLADCMATHPLRKKPEKELRRLIGEAVARQGAGQGSGGGAEALPGPSQQASQAPA